MRKFWLSCKLATTECAQKLIHGIACAGIVAEFLSTAGCGPFQPPEEQDSPGFQLE